MKKFAVMLALLLLATGASLEAQQSSKIVTNATAAGQAGARTAEDLLALTSIGWHWNGKAQFPPPATDSPAEEPKEEANG